MDLTTDDGCVCVCVCVCVCEGYAHNPFSNAPETVFSEGGGDDVIITSLHESVPLLHPHTQSLGIGVLRTLFHLRPDLLPLFPFAEDEHYHAYSVTYKGQIPSLLPGQWGLLFRLAISI